MSQRDYLVADMLHELCAEIWKAMPEEDRKQLEEDRKRIGESREVSDQEVFDVLHELIALAGKAMKKAEEAKQSAMSS